MGEEAKRSTLSSPSHHGEAGPEPADAWTEDKLRRSSLPPDTGSMPRGSVPPASRPPPPLNDGNEEGDALSLIARTAPRPTPDLASEIAERFALGDYSGALRTAQLLLGQAAGHPLAAHYARESQTKLEGLYTSRLTAHGHVPVISVSETDLPWFGLDTRTTQLLSRLDGRAKLEEIIEQSGMNKLDALRLLVELTEQGIIRLV